MDAIKSFNSISQQVDRSKPWDGKVDSTSTSFQEDTRKGGQASSLEYSGQSVSTEGNYRDQGVHETSRSFGEALSKDGVSISHESYESTLKKGEESGRAAEEKFQMFDPKTGETKNIDRETYNKLFSQMTAGKEQWFAQNRVPEPAAQGTAP